MQFLILLGSIDHFDNWDATEDDERARYFRDYKAFAEAVRERGTLIAGDALGRPETANTVKVGEARAVKEGPFAESMEQIGGFYFIDVPDLDTAVNLARLLPREYLVEVRPTVGITV